MDYRKILILAAMAIVVQGCASMSGQECMVADWQAIGYEDGVRGASGDRIGNHRKACAKHGLMAGFYYCSWDNHTRLGSVTWSEAPLSGAFTTQAYRDYSWRRSRNC